MISPKFGRGGARSEATGGGEGLEDRHSFETVTFRQDGVRACPGAYIPFILTAAAGADMYSLAAWDHGCGR